MKAFTYRSGPLHLINPETSVSFCRIEKNPGSPLKAEFIQRWEATKTLGLPDKIWYSEKGQNILKHSRECKNCKLVQQTIREHEADKTNLKNSKAVPVLLPCNLPDLLSTNFYTLMSCIQEYSRVRSY